MASASSKTRISLPEFYKGWAQCYCTQTCKRTQATHCSEKTKIRYTLPMRNYVKSLSGFFFYTLGISFFTAYLLHFNQLGGLWSRWWMDVADLPFALTAMLYAGTSLYDSITTKERVSIAAIVIISMPLIVAFCLLAALNFWDVLNL